MASLIERVFAAHLPGGEWPDELHVDTVAHERSRYWTELAEKRAPRVQHRRWLGTARNVTDANGVEHLTSTRPTAPTPLSKRLSYAAAKVDEINDLPSVHVKPIAPNAIGDRKRARMLRPVLFAVAALTAKSEKAAIVAARRAKRRAAA